MEELIARIVSQVGIDEDIARKAVGIILRFLKSDGPEDAVTKLLEAIPGASDVVAEDSGGGGGGLLGGLMGGMGAMGVFNDLTSAGLGMSEVQGVTKELVGFAREKAGDEAVDAVIGGIPGLSQFT